MTNLLRRIEKLEKIFLPAPLTASDRKLLARLEAARRRLAALRGETSRLEIPSAAGNAVPASAVTRRSAKFSPQAVAEILQRARQRAQQEEMHEQSCREASEICSFGRARFASKGLPMTRGRPFEPGNQFGRGRPKGSRNKKTQQAQKLFEDHAAAIVALAINKSRDDAQMLRMLAGRILLRHRDVPVKIAPLPMNTLADLDRASEAILKRATSGKISLSEAQEVLEMIEHRRRVLMAHDIERRLRALESAEPGSHEGSPPS